MFSKWTLAIFSNVKFGLPGDNLHLHCVALLGSELQIDVFALLLYYLLVKIKSNTVHCVYVVEKQRGESGVRLFIVSNNWTRGVKIWTPLFIFSIELRGNNA